MFILNGILYFVGEIVLLFDAISAGIVYGIWFVSKFIFEGLFKLAEMTTGDGKMVYWALVAFLFITAMFIFLKLGPIVLLWITIGLPIAIMLSKFIVMFILIIATIIIVRNWYYKARHALYTNKKPPLA